MCSLIENSSTGELQSLLAECFYLKGLPRGEAATWLGTSDGSQITAAVGGGGGGVLVVLVDLSTLWHQKKNKLHGLDRHGNRAWLAFEVEGWERSEARERERDAVYELTHKTHSSQVSNVSLLKGSVFKCLSYKLQAAID